MKSPVGLLHSAGFYLHDAASTGERRTSKEVTTFPYIPLPSCSICWIILFKSDDLSFIWCFIELNWIQVAVTISTSQFLTETFEAGLFCSARLSSPAGVSDCQRMFTIVSCSKMLNECGCWETKISLNLLHLRVEESKVVHQTHEQQLLGRNAAFLFNRGSLLKG